MFRNRSHPIGPVLCLCLAQTREVCLVPDTQSLVIGSFRPSLLTHIIFLDSLFPIMARSVRTETVSGDGPSEQSP